MANSILDVKELLNEYSLEVQEAITHESESVAKEGASKSAEIVVKSHLSLQLFRHWFL